MTLILKLLTIVSFIGGPLLLSDAWSPTLGKERAFALSFAPLALILIGSLALGDPPGLWRRLSVGAGVVGALLLLAQNALACWLLLEHPARHADLLTLYVIGIGVGTFCAAAYLALVRTPALLGELEDRLVPGPLREVIRDYALLAVSLGFVGAGAFFWSEAPDRAIVTIVLFGACGSVPLFSLRRRWRAARQLMPSPFVLPPDRTLRPRRTLALGLFGGLFAGGALILYFSGQYPPIFRILIGVVTAVGALGLVAVALGRAPVGYLRFEDTGLTVGYLRYALHVPWSSLGGAVDGELGGQPAVFLSLNDSSAWTTTPPTLRARAAAALERSAAWSGAPIVIVTTYYGVEALPLAQALQSEMDRCVARREWVSAGS